MPLDNAGGLSGIGASLGSAVAGAVRKSPGRTVGKAVGRTLKPRRTYPENRSGGGRRTYPENRSGGGGGGSRYTYPENRPKAPSVPSLAAYLGTDSTYQNVVRGGKRSLADFLSELNRRRGESNTQFTQTKASMERDRTTQLEALRDEFASRGLIQSGLFGEEQGKFQKEFTQQQQVLGQQQAALLADLLGQQKNFQREQELALEAAKQEALQRRAAKYKIGA